MSISRGNRRLGPEPGSAFLGRCGKREDRFLASIFCKREPHSRAYMGKGGYVKDLDRFRLRGKILLAFFLSFGLVGLLVSCQKSSEDLENIFDLEARSAKGAPPQEIEDLKAAIEKYAAIADQKVDADEKVGTYYKLLASRYLQKQMYLEAYEAIVKALDYFPANEGLFYNAALAAGFVAKSKAVLGPAGEGERLRWLDIAESNYRRVLDTSPRYGRALYGLAVLYEFELDRSEDALPLLRRLLETDSKNVDAMLLLGRVLYHLGRLEEAADMYETAAKIASGTQRMSPSSVDKKKAAEDNRARILEELYGKSGEK